MRAMTTGTKQVEAVATFLLLLTITTVWTDFLPYCLWEFNDYARAFSHCIL